MCTIFILAIVRNSSPDRCAVLPLPPEPNDNSPGRAFASAINSRTDLTGSDGCTIRMFGATATMVIGTKSLTGSHDNFGYSAGLTACEPALAITSV